MPYVNHLDPVLAEGAMQEFSKAPYRSTVGLRPRLDPRCLVDELRRRDFPGRRFQTMLTLLAVSGDADAIEPFIEARWRRHQTDSLATLLATYLELRGVDGVELVKARYLRDPNRHWDEIEAALPAVRFHWREPASAISAGEALELFRTVLERPPLASLVIPDLIATEDWQSLDRILEIYREHADRVPWIRPPVLEFLRTCPLPEAKLALESIERESSWGFRRYGRSAGPAS